MSFRKSPDSFVNKEFIQVTLEDDDCFHARISFFLDGKKYYCNTKKYSVREEDKKKALARALRIMASQLEN